MFSNLISSEPSSQTPATLQIEEVRNRLNDSICQKMQGICADNKRRLEESKTNASLLEKGIFFPPEYYYALKRAGAEKQIEELRNCDAFFHGHVSSDHFEPVLNDKSITGKQRFCFTLKKGVCPAEALRTIEKGLSLIECKAVFHIVAYQAIQEILGIDKFYHLFSRDSSTPLVIGLLRPQNPLYRLIETLNETNPNKSMIEKGDLVYFRNRPFYLEKHVDGMAQGFNTICIDDRWGSQKFVALGLEPKGLEEKGIIQVLFEELIQEPDHLDYLSTTTKAALCKDLQVEKWLINPQDCHDLSKWDCTLLSRFDAEKITALANSTLEEARRLLDQW